MYKEFYFYIIYIDVKFNTMERWNYTGRAPIQFFGDWKL